jgi:hypothetical protein
MQGMWGRSGPSEAMLVIIPSLTYERPRLWMTLRILAGENMFSPTSASVRDIKRRLRRRFDESSPTDASSL